MPAFFPSRILGPLSGRRRSLRFSVLVWFLGISLIPLGFVGWSVYRQAAADRGREAQIRLEASADINRSAVQHFFDQIQNDITLQARRLTNLDLMKALLDGRPEGGTHPGPWTHGSSWHGIVQQFGQDLEFHRDWSGLHDILLLDTEGVILFSCLRGPDLGLDVFGHRLGWTDLASACRKALETENPIGTRLLPYPPYPDESSGFLVQSLRDETGLVLGLMVYRFTTRSLESHLVASSQRESTGRIFLVDDEYAVIGDSKLKLEEMESEPGFWHLTDPQGDKLWCIHKPLTLGGQVFGLVAALPVDTASSGLSRLRLTMVLTWVAVCVLVVFAALLLSRRIVLPIAALGLLMQRVASGQGIGDYRSSGHNEVADLEEQFLLMLRRLEEVRSISEREYGLQRAQFDLNERMRAEADPAALARVVLQTVAEHHGAAVGAMYLVAEDGTLELAAHHGLQDSDLPPARITPGSGVVGMAAEQGRVTVLQDVPPSHLPIRTSLGTSTPASLLVAPFQVGGETTGLLELGIPQILSEPDLQFIERSSEGIAAALDMARSRDRVNRLLAETNRQARTLKAQQKQLQVSNSKLERSGQFKDEFLANMSHELRTPLNSMILMSEVLAENRDNNLQDDEVESARIIHQAGNDLLKIINDILDLSMVEAGKLVIRSRPTDLPVLLDHLEGLFAATAENQNLDYRVVVGAEIPTTIVTDEDRLGQVLKNLLNNAFKFTESGTVVLRVRQPGRRETDSLDLGHPGQWLALSVADTGRGMTSEEMGRVFQSFSQADGSIGRKFGGAGLGLSISRELVQLLGGTITVDSLEGKGSTFTVYLPLHGQRIQVRKPEPSSPAPPVEETSQVAASSLERCRSRDQDRPPLKADPRWDGWRGKKVLVGDQDMRTVYALNELLTDQGAQVLLGRSWSACIQLAEENPEIDLVVLNPALSTGPPGSAGARWRTMTTSEAPVILISSGESQQGGSSQDVWISKPLKLNEFHQKGQAVLEGEVVPC